MQVLADRGGKERANDSNYCSVLSIAMDLFMLLDIVVVIPTP